MSEIKDGDKVQIHYTGRLEDGTVFETSDEDKPLEFVVGSDQIITGISMAVLGMKVGETKTVNISPEDGFGEWQPDQATRVDRQYLPHDVHVGAALQANDEESGRTFTVWVVELDDETALLDANHPLAGTNLIFDLEVIAIA